MQKLIKPYTILILYVEKVCCLILWHVATLDLLVAMRAGIEIMVGYQLQLTKNK